MASRGIDPRVRDLIHSNVPVLISSKTNESITESSKLAIVPYGDGKIEIVRQRGRVAAIVSHYSEETVTEKRTLITSGRLNVTAESHNSLGKPLEWIEVTIS